MTKAEIAAEIATTTGIDKAAAVTVIDWKVDPRYGHYIMLQRNLIYTGITRAMKICVPVGTTNALAYAIRQQTVSKRNTKLKERLNT